MEKKVAILPGTIEGIKKINKKLFNSKIYIITNQSGIAISNFKLLTTKRSREICEYVIRKYCKRGAYIDGYAISGVVNHAYVRRRRQYMFIKKLIGNFLTIKPKIGMIKQIMKENNIDKDNVNIYVMGDRYIDAKTAINADGFGILIPFINASNGEEKIKQYLKCKNKKKIYVAKNFIDACDFIIKREK